MKTLTEYAFKKRKEKYNVQKSEAKYWGTYHNIQDFKDENGHWTSKPRKFKRSDGSESVDKTEGWHSRPKHKESLRQVNRAINKRARQLLKKQMFQEIIDNN